MLVISGVSSMSTGLPSFLLHPPLCVPSGEMMVKFFFLKMLGNRGGLRTLRALFLGGERSGLSIVEMYQRLLSEYCAGGAMSSIIGGLPSPISGIALSAAAGKDFNTKLRHLPSRSSQVPLGKRYRALM